ncbi:MAG: cell division protein FtsQ/DivIB [Pseudomonadales bacterium]
MRSVKKKNTRTASPRRGAVSKSRELEKKTRVKQLFMVLLIWIAVVGFGILGFNNAKQMFELDVQNVRVDGEFRKIDQSRVVALVSPYLNDGFFTMDLAPIKQRLEQEPWVYQAQVQRRWPSGINVSIQEQAPIAIWNAVTFLNADGKAFANDREEALQIDLPRLAGGNGQQIVMMQRYQEFSRMLEPLGLSIAELKDDELQGVTAVLRSGIELRFGNEHLIQKMQRFLKLHKRLLKHKLEQLAYIDFRYPSGAAIRWNQTGLDASSKQTAHKAADKKEKLI